MLKRFCFLFCLISSLSPSFSQEITDSLVVPKQRKVHGTFYLFWGYNRDWYSKSTIHFENHVSDNYDFTFYDAQARDKADMENCYKLDQLTIPQYNLHLGYFFNDKRDLGIEFSWDHLKYVVNDYQTMHVKGNVRGHEIDKDTLVTPDFVHLQHTNGNNYLMANLMKKYTFFKKKNVEISAVAKAGAGVLVSYTISTVLGNYDNGYFHYHGWLTGVATELRIDLYKYFYVSTSLQGAFVNYTNTRLGADHQGKSTQHFYSLQYIYGAGFNIPFGK